MLEHTDEATEMSALEGPPPGTVLLGKYRVDWMLGMGGYGYVVKAQHLEHGGNVAIKIMRDDREADPATVGRFEREGRVVAKLESEHVARVFDVGKLPSGAPYMVMELLEGDDLRKRLESGPLPVALAVDYLLQACEAIAEAHGHGIVHRDIKPGNLFVAKLPAKRTILKVLDFGISKSARQYDKRLTQTQSILGTPAYMSPEQMRDPKSVDFATDIWALGAVLYELVEGYLPFDADNFAELVIAVSTEAMRPMQRAPELRPIVERCLAKHPKDRYSSIAQLAMALASFSSSETSRDYVARIHRLLGFTPGEIAEAPRVTPPAPSPPPVVPTVEVRPSTVDTWTAPKRPWWPIAMIAAFVGVAVVVIVALNLGGTPDAPVAKPVEVKAEPKPEPPLAAPEPPKPEPPPVKTEPVVVETPPKKPPVQIKKPPTLAPVVIKPPVATPKDASRCPDGSLVSSHWKGCPKK